MKYQIVIHSKGPNADGTGEAVQRVYTVTIETDRTPEQVSTAVDDALSFGQITEF